MTRIIEFAFRSLNFATRKPTRFKSILFTVQNLNLPEFSFRVRSTGQSKEIFDGIRRKYVALTPEEWVRQHFIRFLVEEMKYPVSFFSVEKELTVNTLKKRTDIVVYGREGNPWMIVECKAPGVEINEETLYQAARYNLKLNASYLVLTNGLNHFCLRTGLDDFVFEEGLPEYTG